MKRKELIDRIQELEAQNRWLEQEISTLQFEINRLRNYQYPPYPTYRPIVPINPYPLNPPYTIRFGWLANNTNVPSARTD